MDKEDIKKLEDKANEEYNIFSEYVKNNFFIDIELLSDKIRSQTRRSLNKYGIELMVNTCDLIADSQYEKNDKLNPEMFISEVRTKCYYINRRENDREYGMKYISGILSNRFPEYTKETMYNCLLNIEEFDFKKAHEAALKSVALDNFFFAFNMRRSNG